MSFSRSEKIYWRIKNAFEVYVKYRNVKGLGCLEHKEDSRDHLFGGWLSMGNPKPTKESVLVGEDWIFDQKDLNICVFASNIMASSHQEGKRFSVRFAVIIAKHAEKYLGKSSSMITGNGFSYLRAGLEIANKIGRLPYEMMPDEINMPWEEYSKDIITEEMLAEAAKYKTSGYKKVQNGKDAVLLLESGYSLVTALKWFSYMNVPSPEDYYLNQQGSYLGGHAIEVNGTRAPNLEFKDYVNTQTFGVMYGLNGKARIKDIFASGFYDVYMMEKINS